MKIFYSKNVFYTYIVILSLSLFFAGTKVQAQQPATDINTELVSLQGAEQAQLQSYVYGLLPTEYLSSAQISSYGTAPYTVANIDADALTGFDIAGHSELSQINFIKINVKQGTAIGTIDMSQLASLSQLKYILVEFNYNPCSGAGCAAVAAANIVTGNLPNVALLYTVSIPN